MAREKPLQHTSAYVSIRQHTYVSIRQHTSAYVSIRQHTYVSIRLHTSDIPAEEWSRRARSRSTTPIASLHSRSASGSALLPPAPPSPSSAPPRAAGHRIPQMSMKRHMLCAGKDAFSSSRHASIMAIPSAHTTSGQAPLRYARLVWRLFLKK
jgi:hypothetical protein